MSESNEPGYRRSAGTPRGLARRAALIAAVADDLAANGLTDFSLRRAARAAGTTHKVLLYYFDGVEDLLVQAMRRLRGQRIANILGQTVHERTLGERVAAFWPVLVDDALGLRVIDQAIGLAMHDPDRFGHLARDAADMYRGPLLELCPADWPAEQSAEVSELILAAIRGLLLEWRTTGDDSRAEAGLRALTRALDREEERGTDREQEHGTDRC